MNPNAIRSAVLAKKTFLYRPEHFLQFLEKNSFENGSPNGHKHDFLSRYEHFIQFLVLFFGKLTPIPVPIRVRA